MKITSVDVFCTNFEKAIGNPIFLKINTDEGIYGFGEAGVAFGNARGGAIGQLRDFAQLIIGMDPMRIAAIWDHLHKNTFWGLGGGTVIFSAMSAIDIALWDIKGKALGVPVYQLLGGKTNDKLRTYASQLQFGYSKPGALAQPEQYAEVAMEAVADGYDAVKVNPLMIAIDGKVNSRYSGLLTYDMLKMGRDRLAAIRDAVGPKVDLMVELHTGTDVSSAIQFGKMIEDLNIYFMEEICAPLNPPLTKKVKEKLDIPLAGGERIYTRFGFRPFLEDRSLDVIQPDLANTGGISEGMKICDMAHTYEITVQCHIAGGPITLAAALQLEAVIPNFLIHEHHVAYLSELARSLEIYNYQPVNGYFSIPDKPGLGQEIPKELIEKCDVATIK